MATLIAQSKTWIHYQLTSLSGSATGQSESIDLAGFHYVSIACVHSGFDSSTSVTWEIQSSNDGGTSWSTLPPDKKTSGTSGSGMLRIYPWRERLLRVAITSAATGTNALVAIYVVAKRK